MRPVYTRGCSKLRRPALSSSSPSFSTFESFFFLFFPILYIFHFARTSPLEIRSELKEMKNKQRSRIGRKIDSLHFGEMSYYCVVL